MPRIAKILTNIFLGLVGIGMAGGAIVLARNLSVALETVELSLLLGMTAIAIGCAVSFLWQPAARLLLAVCLFAMGVGVLGAEFAIAPAPSAFFVDGGAGGKSGRQALLDLRADGKPAYVSLLHADITVPDGSGGLRSVLELEGKPVLPLSGVTRARTLLCNETGNWVSYFSDRFGFRNPDSIWQGAPDIAMVGDSNTQGNCVSDGKSYVDRLRATYPKTVNLGQRGNGPFAILASIREYLPTLRPALTVWFHYEGNDIPSDLKRESRTPIFREYLKPEFSQNLRDNVGSLSAAFAGHIDWRLENASTVAHGGDTGAPVWYSGLKSRLTLYRIRNRIGFANFPNDRMIDTFQSILTRAKSEVARWNGNLLLVYLPTKRRFLSAGERLKLDRYRQRVLASVQSLDIPAIDMTPVFAALRQPEQQYHEHFSEAGHDRIAREVARFIKAHHPKSP